MAAALVVRCLRPAWLDGRALAAGETAKVAPLVAALAVATGRFELVHDADAAEARAALEADTRRVLAQAGRPWRGPQVSEPWQRIE